MNASMAKRKMSRRSLLSDARRLRELFRMEGLWWRASVVNDLVSELRRETRAARAAERRQMAARARQMREGA